MRRRLSIRAAGALMLLGLIGGCGGDGASTDTTTAPVAPSTTAAADQNVTETETSWTYFCTIHPSMTGSLIVEA